MTCKAKTEVFARVVGFYRPVQDYNPGKQAEYHARVTFDLTKSVQKLEEIAPETEGE